MNTLFSLSLLRASFVVSLFTVVLLGLTASIGLFPQQREAQAQSRSAITDAIAGHLAATATLSPIFGNSQSEPLNVSDKQFNLEMHRWQDYHHQVQWLATRYPEIQSLNLHDALGNSFALINDPTFELGFGAVHLASPTAALSRPAGTAQATKDTYQHTISITPDHSLLVSVGFAKVNLWRSFLYSSATSLLAIGLVSFIACWLYLWRKLEGMHPKVVIPRRVRSAVDSLSEGLVMLDTRCHVMFTNNAFAKKIGMMREAIGGYQFSTFEWQEPDGELPWDTVLATGQPVQGARIHLISPLKITLTFNVNASPILSAEQVLSGVLVTFDDVTKFEIQNDELNRAVVDLQRSQKEIERQNSELEVLANRDALTGLYNRRYLMHKFADLFRMAHTKGTEISCIVADIDHFKSVNDNYGHGTGDKVVEYVAQVLSKCSSVTDVPGRYGGEEFVVVLPNTPNDLAVMVAERMRKTLVSRKGADYSDDIYVTASFGVATINNQITDHEQLLDAADKAMYEAKKAGRNRVSSFNDESIEGSTAPNAPLTMLEQSPMRSESRIQPHPFHSLYTPNEGILVIDRVTQSILRAKRQQRSVGVMAIEIDAMRVASHTLGLTVNRELANSVLSIFKNVLRTTDSVVMLEDKQLFLDAFVPYSSQILVLLPDIADADKIMIVLNRLLRLEQASVMVGGQEFMCTPTIGISQYPEDGDNANTLIRNAMSACIKAKRELGMNYCFYSDEVNSKVRRSVELQSELHFAIEREQLDVVYQPIIDLEHGNIHRVEALLRWTHPSYGRISPSEFIPLAEMSDLIQKITLWLVGTVSRQLQMWQAEGLNDLFVSLNLSQTTLREAKNVRQIITQVAFYNIAPQKMEFEISESSEVEDLDTVVSALGTLCETGFTIALDDFGAGNTSLSYLQQLPINTLKVDKSFVEKVGTGTVDDTIVSSLIVLGHSLNLKVIAEGVETSEQLQWLQRMQCDWVQGYIVSRPVAAELIVQMCRTPYKIKQLVDDHSYAQAYSNSGKTEFILD